MINALQLLKKKKIAIQLNTLDLRPAFLTELLAFKFYMKTL